MPKLPWVAQRARSSIWGQPERIVSLVVGRKNLCQYSPHCTLDRYRNDEMTGLCAGCVQIIDCIHLWTLLIYICHGRWGFFDCEGKLCSYYLQVYPGAPDPEVSAIWTVNKWQHWWSVCPRRQESRSLRRLHFFLCTWLIVIKVVSCAFMGIISIHPSLTVGSLSLWGVALLSPPCCIIKYAFPPAIWICYDMHVHVDGEC